MIYECASKHFINYHNTFLGCKQNTELKPKDPIKCKHCDYKILYKKRTKQRKNSKK